MILSTPEQIQLLNCQENDEKAYPMINLYKNEDLYKIILSCILIN